MDQHPQNQIGAENRPISPWVNRVRGWFGSEQGKIWSLVGSLGLAVLVSYWLTLGIMVDRWWHDPQYSHGFLVPVFAAAVLWFRREQLRGVQMRPSCWGLAMLGAGFGLRLAGTVLDIDSVDAFSLLPTLAGLVWLVGGLAVWRWSWPAIVFLGFMLPMPYQLEIALAQPLRWLATEASTYVLQTLGFPALAEGNIIHIDQLKLGVIDACSGLGMLVTFFALATATAMVVKVPWLDRAVLVVSAIPIALIANITRITGTAVAHATLGEAAGKAVMHDLAGLLMMPLALGLLWLELRLLAHLLVPAAEGQGQPLFVPGILPSGDRGSPILNPALVKKSFGDLREMPSLPTSGGS